MDAIYVIFLFIIGATVGSFLNVVIYRLPRGQSIVFPGSHCPVCGRGIRWYDNVPLLSYLALRGRCRFCKTGISPRYLLIELTTAVLVAGLYVAYFMLEVRTPTGSGELRWKALNFAEAWPMFAAHAALLCGLLVCAAVDIELWIVPLEVTWFVSLVGVAAATFQRHAFMPAVSPDTALVAVAGLVGLAISLILMHLGVLQPSFLDAADKPIVQPSASKEGSRKKGKNAKAGRSSDAKAVAKKKSQPKLVAVAITAGNGVNPRKEVLRELLFLLPALALGAAAWLAMDLVPSVSSAVTGLLSDRQSPLLAPHLQGFCGAVFGYLVGGLWIWGTRILGTLAFNKEAMGMGDVHILAAVGAVTGWIIPSIAFFVAPFMGLLWALYLLARRNQRELPYGPWLALASVLVMVFYDSFAQLLQTYAGVFNLTF